MSGSAPLILASTSPYRKELLARLGLPFTCVTPDFAEALPGSMPPIDLVRHNTLGKARSVAVQHPEAAVIGSDQIAVCGEAVLGKPGSHDKAAQQLASVSGKAVEFLTGVVLIRSDKEQYACVPFRVNFRELSAREIDNYLVVDQPYDCAGSFKSESLGIALFESMQGDDPTTLTGLPLITLSAWLHPLRRG